MTLKQKPLDVAVVIVSWNVSDFIAACLTSVFTEIEREDIEGRVWVVDNASTDDSVLRIRERFPQVSLICNDHNPGFGAANNQGMAAAADYQPRTYFLLNPDTRLQPGALKALFDGLERLPRAGMVGPRLIYGDGRLQHSAFRFPGLLQLLFDLFPMPARLYDSRWNGRYPARLFESHQPPFKVDFPLGAAMLVRADVAGQTKGFNEAYHMYCEEIEWCWRMAEAGWHVYTVPAAEVVHYGGQSTGQRPARSTIALWCSRRRLYQQYLPPWRFRTARWLVRLGLNRRAAQAADSEQAGAYHQARACWE